MSIGGYTMGVFSQDGKFILTNGGENTLKLWDGISGALLKNFEGHSKSVNSVCFSADGNFILSGWKFHFKRLRRLFHQIMG